MQRADELAIMEVPHRKDIDCIDHHDAEYIAAAGPQTMLALLDEIDRLQDDTLKYFQETCKLHGEIESLINDKQLLSAEVTRLREGLEYLRDNPVNPLSSQVFASFEEWRTGPQR